MLEHVTEEKTLQEIAFETNQGYVLKALGIPTEQDIVMLHQD